MIFDIRTYTNFRYEKRKTKEPKYFSVIIRISLFPILSLKKASALYLYAFQERQDYFRNIQSPNLFRYTKLLLDDVLQLLSSSGETRDTLTKLLNSHLVLVEVKAEERLVVEVLFLG